MPIFLRPRTVRRSKIGGGGGGVSVRDDLTDANGRSGGGDATAAALITMAGLGLAGLSIFFPHRLPPVAQQTTAEHVEQLGLSDTSVQRRAHVILVFLSF